MNIKTSLLLAGLVALTATANAAQSPADANVVVLPTYVVVAPRLLPAEQQIRANLDELRQQAKAPVFIITKLPLVKEYFAQQVNAVKVSRHAVIAKS
jgi:hypothetical protein